MKTTFGLSHALVASDIFQTKYHPPTESLFWRD